MSLDSSKENRHNRRLFVFSVSEPALSEVEGCLRGEKLSSLRSFELLPKSGKLLLHFRDLSPQFRHFTLEPGEAIFVP
jgi:hypothetical protein